MEANKILSASFLDLIFDDRNKEYGAYELRITYPERIKKSLIVVFIIAAVAITGAALANSLNPKPGGRLSYTVIALPDIIPDEEEVIPPPPPKKPEPVPTKAVQYTNPVIVDEEADPFAEQDEIDKAKIDVKDQDGLEDKGFIEVVNEIDHGKGIIEPPKDIYDGPRTIVEVDAKFNGNWEKFLRTNLDPIVPVDKGAPAGRYNVIIQFVVDLDGSVSDTKPLTAYGYGMEEEAMRVLKKAVKWEPAIQNGHRVKAYRRQPITFVVEESH